MDAEQSLLPWPEGGIMDAMSTAQRFWALVGATLLLVGCGSTTALSDESGPAGPEMETVREAPQVDVDIVGTWYACRGVFEFEADGSWAFEDHTGCTAVGTWTGEGTTIDWRATSTDCARSPAVGRVTAARTDNALLLHSSEYPNGTATLLDENTPRSDWKLEGTIDDIQSTGVNMVHVVGTPREGFASACYWSPNPDSDGLMSSGGWIEIWKHTADKFMAKSSCSGGCPCGAVLSGTPQPDGSITGHYNAVNCARVFSGEFTLTPVEE